MDKAKNVERNTIFMNCQNNSVSLSLLVKDSGILKTRLAHVAKKSTWRTIFNSIRFFLQSEHVKWFEYYTRYLDKKIIENYFNVMTDHKEEQELELEALNSIYPEEFSREYQSNPIIQFWL